VKAVVDLAVAAWSQPVEIKLDERFQPHEAGLLMIDATRSQQLLDWKPSFSLEQAVNMVVAFTRAWQQGEDLRDHCLDCISAFPCSS
jgi:CDP-glucose 4,6-dehydratase